ncbi:ATP-grasp domain-containing protein [Pseudomonas sp. NPDC089547]|uniref:ATP-grasp domain-containing protein n=1 Tax=Pseudomonas sp. NPDC089547 TaxID=3390652 RepID=UPI003D01F0ED
MTDSNVIVVVDPVSSAVYFGNAIQAKGYRAVALISVKKLSASLKRLQDLKEFQHIVYAEDLDSAIELLSRLRVCAVVPGSDLGVCLADKISNYYGLVGNLIETSLSRTDKGSQKATLIRKGVAVGWGIEMEASDDKRETLKLLKYPVVVKPCRGTGSRNVKMCTNISEVDESISNIRNNAEARGDEERKVLVEEYLGGEEYFAVTANYGISGDKQLICFAVYEKITRGRSPSVYKNIRSLPLDDGRAQFAFRYVKAVNAALDFAYGINDVELKIGLRGPLMIEQNGRVPGALVPKLIGLCTGVDCYQLALDIYLGEKVTPISSLVFQRHFCICCLISERSGVVEKINGLEEVQNLKSFNMMSLHVDVGDHVDLTLDFLSSWGMVFLVHDDLDVLQAESEVVHEKLSLQYQSRRV